MLFSVTHEWRLSLQNALAVLVQPTNLPYIERSPNYSFYIEAEGRSETKVSIKL